MNQPRKPKKVKAPEGVSLEFSGKQFDVLKLMGYSETYGYLFTIKTPQSSIDFLCKEKQCAHLKSKDWIVTEWEDEPNN